MSRKHSTELIIVNCLVQYLSEVCRNACISRILINFYVGNHVRVVCNGVMSDYFTAVNGVKQGGVLSPVLFYIYIDGLLLVLQKANVGCCIGSCFVGALAYADDITLLAPTPTAVGKMLDLCQALNVWRLYLDLSNMCHVTCMIVSFLLEVMQSEFVKSFSHLGHIISTELDDSADIAEKRNDFINQTNNVLCYFRKLTSYIKCQLVNSYCMSLYGCELWLLSSPNIDNICVSWRKSLRRVWDLPYNTHCDFLPLLSCTLPLFDVICRRCLSFLFNCIHSKSSLVRYIATYGIVYCRACSIIGRNVLFYLQRYNCLLNEFLSGCMPSMIMKFCQSRISDDTLRSANFFTAGIMLRMNSCIGMKLMTLLAIYALVKLTFFRLPTGCLLTLRGFYCIIMYICVRINIINNINIAVFLKSLENYTVHKCHQVLTLHLDKAKTEYKTSTTVFSLIKRNARNSNDWRLPTYSPFAADETETQCFTLDDIL
jgi:hypothetical protein